MGPASPSSGLARRSRRQCPAATAARCADAASDHRNPPGPAAPSRTCSRASRAAAPRPRGFPEPPATSERGRPRARLPARPRRDPLYNVETDPAKKPHAATRSSTRAWPRSTAASPSSIARSTPRASARASAPTGRARADRGIDGVDRQHDADGLVGHRDRRRRCRCRLRQARALFDKTLPALDGADGRRARDPGRLIRASAQLPVESYTLFAADSDLQYVCARRSIPGAIARSPRTPGRRRRRRSRKCRSLTRGVFERTASKARCRASSGSPRASPTATTRSSFDWPGKNELD